VTARGPTASSRRGTGFEPLSWEEAERKADAALTQMTDAEKHGFIIGSGWSSWNPLGPDPGYYTGNTPAVPRLSIPALKMADAANGFRAMGFPFSDDVRGSTTAYPSMLALAATWDPGLVEDVASAIGVEFRGKGANVLLGPSVQVHRTASGGRNFEYLSGEDPYLGAVLTRAYVRGVQGEGVMAVAKHWAFNEQETYRHSGSVTVDERTAFELYYPPFEAAVEEGASGFMCAYNKVNGTYACHSEDLLKRDLKTRLGFRGWVQTDWGALKGNPLAPFAGLDQEMPGNEQILRYDADLYAPNTDDTKRVREVVTGAARRFLATIYRMRLDEDYAKGGELSCTPPNCVAERMSDQRSWEHQRLAGSAATKSVVLLKNNGILPLNSSSIRKIALLGFTADLTGNYLPSFFRNLPYFGFGSGMVMPHSVLTPLKAIQDEAGRMGVEVLSPQRFPTAACIRHPCAEDLAAAVEVASQADVIIINDAISSGEGADRNSELNEMIPDFGFGFSLPMLSYMKNQTDLELRWTGPLVSAVASLKKPIVVLMQTPGAVTMPWLSEVDAVANLFLAGEQTGHAWASMLFGSVSPEGKLPIMMPATINDTILPAQEMTYEYTEKLFTSYRNPSLKAAFPFGHGLSYTTFEFGTVSVVRGSHCAVEVCARLTVTNTGKRAGREVVQAYLEFSQAKDTPARVLRGFFKTRLLEAGDAQEVLFNFTQRDYSIYQVGTGWVAQDAVLAHVGSSSIDIRQVVELVGTSGASSAPHSASSAGASGSAQEAKKQDGAKKKKKAKQMSTTTPQTATPQSPETDEL